MLAEALKGEVEVYLEVAEAREKGLNTFWSCALVLPNRLV